MIYSNWKRKEYQKQLQREWFWIKMLLILALVILGIC